MILLQHIFIQIQLKTENLKSVFWVQEFGYASWYIGLPYNLGTTLIWIYG